MPRPFSSRLNRYLDKGTRLRPDQVATLLGVDRRTVMNRMKEGKLRFEIFCGRPVILWGEVLRFLRAGATIPSEEESDEAIIPANGLVDLLDPEDVATRMERSRYTVRRWITEQIVPATDVAQGDRPTHRIFEGHV